MPLDSPWVYRKQIFSVCLSGMDMGLRQQLEKHLGSQKDFPTSIGRAAVFEEPVYAGRRPGCCSADSHPPAVKSLSHECALLGRRMAGSSFCSWRFSHSQIWPCDSVPFQVIEASMLQDFSLEITLSYGTNAFT